MSRIRSIHPGLFTDEAFMTASPLARLLVVGLWTEAWDDGVFEWKPMTLKARLFAADAVQPVELLTELEGLGFLCRFSVAGKQYGAIRNFRKWQKPKFPNSSNVLPEELREYVGLTSEITEELPKPSGNPTEKSLLMEEGGGKREDEEEKKKDALRAKRRALEEEFDFEFWPAYPHKIGKPKALLSFFKVRESHALAVVLDGLSRYITGKPPDRQWLNPATFLNQERFLDQPAQVLPFSLRVSHATEARRELDAAVLDFIDEVRQ